MFDIQGSGGGNIQKEGGKYPEFEPKWHIAVASSKSCACGSRHGAGQSLLAIVGLVLLCQVVNSTMHCSSHDERTSC